jgi:hypothetical protein
MEKERKKERERNELKAVHKNKFVNNKYMHHRQQQNGTKI